MKIPQLSEAGGATPLGFQLTREPAQKPPAVAGQFDDNHGRQTFLLSGLDCLPEQRDLFAVDGDRE